MMRGIYKKCGLSEASSHTGRKSIVTNSVINGVPLEKMSRMLGHLSVETTIKYVVVDQNRVSEMLAIE